ncbi:MAG: PorT family protein, partial [Bacteroidia bacterium]
TMFDRRFQPIHIFGIKAGVNVANQYSPGSKEVFEAKSIAGINAGGYYSYFISRVLGVQAELSVSVKGSHWKDYNFSQEEAKDILTYFDLPLLIRYQPVPLISIHAGPQVSYLARAMQYDYETKLKGAIDEYYKLLDFGLVFGIEANLPNNIGFTVRYVRGLKSVYAPDGYNFESYNNYFQFTAGYRFEREMKLQSRSKKNIKRKK